MSKCWKKLMVCSLAAGLLGVNIVSMGDVKTAESRKIAVLSVEGEEAFVVRGSARETRAAAGVPLGQGSRVRTGEETSLYLEADDDKTIKLGENSQAEITKASSKKLKLTLKNGSMFFNVDKPLGEGEELQFDAAQTSMSIRGTSGILQFGESDIRLYLMEGHVEWTVGNQVVSVNPGQSAVIVKGDGEKLSVSDMNSSYVFEGTVPFSWQDLDEMALDTILEQCQNLDLGAIGLGTLEEQKRAGERLAEMVNQRIEEEKRIREEAEAAELRRQQEEKWNRRNERDEAEENEAEESEDEEIYPEEDLNPDTSTDTSTDTTTDTSTDTTTDTSTDTTTDTSTDTTTDTTTTTTAEY